MVHVSDIQITQLVKPFQMIKQALEDTPENKQYMNMVNECLSILNNAKPSPLGGSSPTIVTKQLFEMFHLTDRL